MSLSCDEDEGSKHEDEEEEVHEPLLDLMMASVLRHLHRHRLHQDSKEKHEKQKQKKGKTRMMMLTMALQA